MNHFKGHLRSCSSGRICKILKVKNNPDNFVFLNGFINVNYTSVSEDIHGYLKTRGSQKNTK